MSSSAVVSFASLILADAGLDITSDNLLSLSKAAGAQIDSVCWTFIFIIFKNIQA